MRALKRITYRQTTPKKRANHTDTRKNYYNYKMLTTTAKTAQAKQQAVVNKEEAKKDINFYSIELPDLINSNDLFELDSGQE